jgi:acyl carrier protein
MNGSKLRVEFADMSDIETILTDYIITQIVKRPKYPLGYDTALISSGLIDSFHLVDLSIYIEEKFGVRIDDSELNAEAFDTVHELSELIRQKQG